jgi:hypothetical protein
MSRTAWLALAALLVLLATSRVEAQFVVAPPPAAPCYAPAPVVSYYAPPVVSYYAPPVVSYYAPAPVVSYYAPPAVSSYYAPPTAVTTTRYGLFGRPRASVTRYYYP